MISELLNFNEKDTYSSIGITTERREEIVRLWEIDITEISANKEDYTFIGTEEDGENEGETGLHFGKCMKRFLAHAQTPGEEIFSVMNIDIFMHKLMDAMMNSVIADSILKDVFKKDM